MKNNTDNLKKYHYVYRITNTKAKKHYYGCRTSKNEPKLDLGIKYFSSSTDSNFLLEQKENRSVFKYKIIKIFDTRKEAEIFETFLHEKFQVQTHDSFYNKAKNTLMGFSVEGRKQTEEHKINNKKHIKGKTYEERYGEERAKELKEKLSEAKKNPSEETRKKISISKTGVPLSDSHKQSISEGGCIRWASMNDEDREEFREKMIKINQCEEKRKDASKKLKQKWKEPEYLEKMKIRNEKSPFKETVVCNYCKKEGKKGPMARWHFENCKLKDNNENKEN